MDNASPSKPSFWKGKSKNPDPDVESESEQLNPIITYRHLLSQTLGPRDPLRVIALCDSDAFYAACEMVRLGTDPNVPLVVQQWDSLIAVNYPARKFGISRMDKAKDAKKKCPELVCVHVATYKEGQGEPGYWGEVDSKTHKVSLDPYRRESAKILGMFKEGLPNAEIEKASIDEAFFDLTRPVREILVQRYPHLVSVPSTGIDTPLPPPPPINWDGLGHIISINPTSLTGETTNEVKAADASTSSAVVSENPLEDHSEDLPATWHDVALSIGAELMAKVREEVRTKLGYTTSAGIARNKFLAKLSASYRKPNSQSILRNAAIPNYLEPMPFQKIRFLGGKLGKAIAEQYDASTVGDLLSISVEEMQSKFGESAIWVWEVLRGIDRSEVKAKPVLTKSMLASKNLPDPITKPSQGKHWIRVLAAELAHRLREARQEHPTLWPKTLVLSAAKGYQAGRSKQASFPFIRDITVDAIAAAGDKLWKELIGTTHDSLNMKITHVQLGFTGIGTVGVGQGSIEGFLKTPLPVGPSTAKKRERSLGRGDLEQEDDEDALPFTDGLQNDEFGPASSSSITIRGIASMVEDGCHSTPSFTCGRCGKKINLAVDDHIVTDGSRIEDDNDAKRVVGSRLDALRREHEDYHFALDLSRQTNGTLKVGTPVSSSSLRKKRKTDAQSNSKGKPRGIEKFFNAK